ncbi:hypothetical protein [Psychrobacillus lasiicapitis]|uniref:Uncharacterized protein n=1 Tax=Psychrobacillus lasiicapitis TaxID=1636719 RepID=A0A544SRH0_9BACI|nr:hypothetical protein [Psychrobacillus lasiicapitis]TQR07773.1 hypothetical protein FG382_22255 [Psychrobacillus lasiicapitis]GGA49029.1 hypothetical protein GCM10011384_43410 [Psychrobacillus lasiicapitis]
MIKIGDGIVWMIIFLTIVIGDGLALYLYKKKKFPIWISAIVLAFLSLGVVFSFVSLGIHYGNKSYNGNSAGDEWQGIAFAGGFIAIVLALNAIVLFVIGVILNIYTFIKKKQKA